MANDFVVNPIVEYDGYFKLGNNIMGINSDIKTREEIKKVDFSIELDGTRQVIPLTFFKKSGAVYFSVSIVFPATEDAEAETVIKYCKQLDGEITYLAEAKFPAEPEIARASGTFGDVKLSTMDYNGETISVAKRKYDEPLRFVDNAIAIDGGVLLSVQDGRGPSRPSGLLFWPNGKRYMDKWKDKGLLF